MTETLIQVLIGVLIIASVILIVVLWRFYEVLSDTKETTAIISKRVKQLDVAYEKTRSSVSDFANVIKGFVYSFDFIKMIREKIKTKVEEKDEER